MSFTKYILEDKTNRKYLVIAFAGGIIQLVIFKLFYPFADFFSDSYYYIFSAKENLNVSIWPIGYSKFLALVHGITHSDTALVTLQYFMYIASALYFFFTYIYLRPIENGIHKIIFVFLFFNPLFLYLCNYVNSDPLFLALSLVWFTELLWLMYRPSTGHIIAHALLLFACFTVRNNAYYYPIVSIAAFLFSQQSWVRKAFGIAVPIAMIVLFVRKTENEALKLTGTKQFSLFTGWQLANNALYAYPYSKIDSTRFQTHETKELNQMAAIFFNNVGDNFKAVSSDYVGNFFIRQPQSPLKLFYTKHYPSSSMKDKVVMWGQCSPVFKDFGLGVIKSDYGAYVKHFIIPNTKNYFLPPLEKLEEYNTGRLDVSTTALEWFDYSSTKVSAVSISAQERILFTLPLFFLCMNLTGLFGGAWLLLKYYKNKTPINKPLLVAYLFCFLNFLFSITATQIVFRYEVFPMLLLLFVSAVIFKAIDQKKPQREKVPLKMSNQL